MRKLSKFFRLEFSQKILFIKSLILLSFFFILGRTLPFNVFIKFYKFLLKLPFGSKTNPELMSDYIKSIKLASSLLPAFFVCLPQALVLRYYFRNIPETYIKIGIKKSEGTLLSHAWVEYKGDFLIGDLPDFDFKPIWEI